jgi:hypothetical protein
MKNQTMNFWTNILRYPRFFISAIIGLFLVLISPFLKLLKHKNNKIIFFFIVFGSFTFSIFFILNLMLNADSY